MKLLRRNLRDFTYKPYLGKQEVLDNGRHTGRYEVQYGDPVSYRGNFDMAHGDVQRQLFGINLDYTHTLLLDDPNADIREYGRITYKGAEYEIKGVRPTLNVLSLALKKLTAPEQQG